MRKTSNLRQLTEYGRQSEARNFKMAQHIYKRLSYFSPWINALRNGTKLVATAPRVFLQPRENVAKLHCLPKERPPFYFSNNPVKN